MDVRSLAKESEKGICITQSTKVSPYLYVGCSQKRKNHRRKLIQGQDWRKSSGLQRSCDLIWVKLKNRPRRDGCYESLSAIEQNSINCSPKIRYLRFFGAFCTYSVDQNY
ncbi:hypothetical protein CH305_19530 [Rhodococcus sp. 15-649-2-2]|nr:hypothetical protein CH305_19530 [Rhodococcus sp. 15-649-2-2]